MTIADKLTFIEYTGNGVIKDFVFDFPFLREEDIKVYLDNEEQHSGHSIINISPDNQSGTIRFLVAPSEGVVVTIRREVPYTFEEEFNPYKAIPAESLENALSRATMQIQQLRDFPQNKGAKGDKGDPGEGGGGLFEEIDPTVDDVYKKGNTNLIPASKLPVVQSTENTETVTLQLQRREEVTLYVGSQTALENDDIITLSSALWTGDTLNFDNIIFIVDTHKDEGDDDTHPVKRYRVSDLYANRGSSTRTFIVDTVNSPTHSVNIFEFRVLGATRIQVFGLTDDSGGTPRQAILRIYGERYVENEVTVSGGGIPTVNELPEDNSQYSVVRLLTEDNRLYLWDGTAFVPFGGLLDISIYNILLDSDGNPITTEAGEFLEFT